MVTYADWSFYDGTYKGAMGSVTIPQTSFGCYAIKASNEIKRRTFDNIGDDIPESVKFCMCELAEHLYQCDQKTESDGITSEKDGSWSVSYESSEQIKKKNNDKTLNIIYQYLSCTGLLYAGV